MYLCSVLIGDWLFDSTKIRFIKIVLTFIQSTLLLCENNSNRSEICVFDLN